MLPDPKRYMSRYRGLWDRLNYEYQRRVREEGELNVEAEISGGETDFAVEANWLRKRFAAYVKTRERMIDDVSRC